MEFDLAFNASYLVAFTMGIFSSVHCIGMCGSMIGTLTLSLSPKIRQCKWRLFFFVLSYNIGRISSYALAGAIVGLLGTLFNLPIIHGEGHRALQLFSATIMVGAGFYIAGWFPRFAYIEKLGSRFWHLIEPFGRRLIPVQTHLHALFFGMIWGWLPCGLVYGALTLSATTGNVLKSSLTMLAFGLGTLPAVIGVGIMTGFLANLSRMRGFKQIVGLLMIALALVALFPWLNPMRLQPT
ncbi:MAG: sulfite exporter TauE/SafE family protein [Methylococcales bacterium]|nr:sulfite exporter TauE/SafE family protein [Methylococcales bacterium]